MYLKYVEPYDLSEDELKEEIVLSIRDMIESWPEHFEGDPQAIPSNEIDTHLFLSSITELPPLQKLQAAILVRDRIVGLRIVYRLVNAIRWEAEIEIRILAIISFLFSSQFLGIRYWLATDLIEKALKEQLIYDPEPIFDCLLNPYDENSAEMRPACESAAEEEIGRVMMNSLTKDRFMEVITKFENSFESQIRKALPNIFVEISFRLAMEATMASADIINEATGDTDELDAKSFSELIEEFTRKGKRFTHERLGIRRGGSRTTQKFVWNDDRKREFYETTANLVHKNGDPLWEFAHKELVGKDFSYRIIEWLRTETDLKYVSIDLWNKAIKSWKGHENSFVRLSAEVKPDAFAMYHAMYLLDYPETAFSTMKKYFGQGKKLSVANKDA